ncbi:MAG: hypothetical protein JWN88_2456 [Frankiales bacterium]|nr:hypothetical protein [Frankiales bacterium]
MRTDESKDLGVLTGLALSGGVQRISEMHAGVASRVFSSAALGLGPAVKPVRAVHDGVARAAYGAVQGALGRGARLAGTAYSKRVPTDGISLGDVPGARVALGILNGAHGDLVRERAAALALPMALRHRGSDLEPVRSALEAAHPDATNRLVVFLHGLVETDDAWRLYSEKHYGERGVTYGSLLRRDLGYTPVWVRFNSGLRVSENGHDLDLLLDRLVDQWPVPVKDLVLIGHSMGGLVARSALAQAGDGTARGERRWPALVRDTVTLGTPHSGAPLARGVETLSRLLRKVGETRWIANQLDARSVGIQDMGRGNVVEADWASATAEGRGRPSPQRAHVPLHPGARHFVVLSTLARRHDSPAGKLFGDLLVMPDSAVGAGRGPSLEFPSDAVCRLTGLHHFELLNHPDVYAAIRTWLADRPEGERADRGAARSLDDGTEESAR